MAWQKRLLVGLKAMHPPQRPYRAPLKAEAPELVARNATTTSLAPRHSERLQVAFLQDPGLHPGLDPAQGPAPDPGLAPAPAPALARVATQMRS